MIFVEVDRDRSREFQEVQINGSADDIIYAVQSAKTKLPKPFAFLAITV